MPRVLQVLHGFPPREVAGTEMSAFRLGRRLRERGWEVHVLAATRAPGRPQYALLEEPGVTRLVNNVPWRPLGDAERDRAVEALARDVFRRVRPDLVHVHHFAFLSSGLRFPVPTVGTLHDCWAWCPAGGLMLRMGRTPCPDPSVEACPECYGRHARQAGRGERLAVGLAGLVAPLVSPEVLHGAWRRLPTSLRATLAGPPLPPDPGGLPRRQEALREAWRALDRRVAPSRWLAAEAARRGLGPVEVLPHGVPPGPPRAGGGPFVYLGSILPHKGVHVVVEGVRRAFGGAAPGLRIHGPVGDPAYARGLGHPLAGPLDPEAVGGVLAGASALVMGSLWPENAPLVVLEARAAGCPVVAPAVGGIPELVVDGRDGLLYRPGDVADLARQLRRLVDGPPLPVAAPPTLDHHASLVERLYRELLPRGGGA